MSVFLFFVQAVIISMSGVLAPGPVTTASIMMGMKNRYAGSLISIGHGIVEFPLIILITLGLGKIFEFKIAQIVIGLAGGGMLCRLGRNGDSPHRLPDSNSWRGLNLRSVRRCDRD